ncbi:sunset domain-containing protein [Lactiplantibacillus paraplantarum]|uniref:sunset domain-containing protein n=1 Tax=Lactiplantibacillus paraplantarum TaxID=60520 RepID=UPI002073AA01|nr:cell surface protein [Lactiplantibacillus paraplantarum]
MHHAKKLVVALTSLLILTGCTTGNQPAANHPSVKTKTVRVEKRTTANKAAWAKAKAASRANAASAKALSSSTTQLAMATSQAKRQSEQLKEKHDDAMASSKSAASEVAAQSRSQSEAQSVAAVSQSKQAAKASSQAAAQNQQTQTSTATTSRENNFSGDTDTAQTGRIVGNRNSKIYHVETGQNYRMAGKNAVYFSTEAEAQAAGYRKSLR